MTEPLPLNTSHLPVKLRVADYLMLDDAGAFADYAKTELIEGEILFMNAQHRPHARIKSRLFRMLGDALDRLLEPMEAIVEGSLEIPPDSAPEPDIVVTDDPEGRGLIPLASVRLIVEVADTTLGFDTRRKLALYARSGVPEYWVVDVNARTVLQHAQPAGDGYARRTDVPFGQPVTAATIPGLSVATTTL